MSLSESAAGQRPPDACAAPMAPRTCLSPRPPRRVAREDERPVHHRGEAEGAAHMGEALVHAARIEAGRHGGEMRRLKGGGEQLIDARDGEAEAPDPAVAPGLACAPFDGVVAVLGIEAERVEFAFRGVAPAAVLDHHGVAVPRIDRRMVVDVGLGDALVVGLALDQGRDRPARGRAPDVAGEAHAVPHRHRNVGLDHDPGGLARVRHVRPPNSRGSLARIPPPVETGAGRNGRRLTRPGCGRHTRKRRTDTQ